MKPHLILLLFVSIHSAPIKIVRAGDSITRLYCSQSQNFKTWMDSAGIEHQMAGSQTYGSGAAHEWNEGYSGAGLSFFLTYHDSHRDIPMGYVPAEHMFTEYSPDIVFLLIGCNDGGLSDEVFESKYNELLDVFELNGTMVKQFFVSLLTPKRGSADARVVEQNAIIERIVTTRIAAAKPYTLCDAHSILDPSVDIRQSDGIHPVESGLAKINKMFFEELTAYLGQGVSIRDEQRYREALSPALQTNPGYSVSVFNALGMRCGRAPLSARYHTRLSPSAAGGIYFFATETAPRPAKPFRGGMSVLSSK